MVWGRVENSRAFCNSQHWRIFGIPLVADSSSSSMVVNCFQQINSTGYRKTSGNYIGIQDLFIYSQSECKNWFCCLSFVWNSWFWRKWYPSSDFSLDKRPENPIRRSLIPENQGWESRRSNYTYRTLFSFKMSTIFCESHILLNYW